MSWSEWKAFTSTNIATVPEASGVYRLDTTKETLYIGRTDDLRRRLTDHMNSNDACIKKATLFRYLVTSSPERTEDELLKAYAAQHGRLPECNEKQD